MNAVRAKRSEGGQSRLFGSSAPLFPDIPFLHRFSCRGVFGLLAFFLVCGVLAGSVAAVGFRLFEGRSADPLLFSGIPQPEAGFLSCFTTLLLNASIWLIALFLLGLSAFGVLGVPVFVFFKGVTIGIGALSYFSEGGLSGLGRCALYDIPVAAVFSLLLLLFAVRSQIVSSRLARSGFAAGESGLSFWDYLKDLFLFLSFAVAASLAGSLEVTLCGVFFS